MVALLVMAYPVPKAVIMPSPSPVSMLGIASVVDADVSIASASTSDYVIAIAGIYKFLVVNGDVAVITANPNDYVVTVGAIDRATADKGKTKPSANDYVAPIKNISNGSIEYFTLLGQGNNIILVSKRYI
jgi:hypothetical protein